MYKKYINKLCNILKINNPIVIYNNELGFSYFNNKIYVKRINDKKKFLFLLFHELRHYFQDYYICNFNNEISDIWKYEFDNYNMDNYLNYNIELDAYSFAYISMKYFNIEYKMPDEIRDNVLRYIEEHKYLYLGIFV